MTSRMRSKPIEKDWVSAMRLLHQELLVGHQVFRLLGPCAIGAQDFAVRHVEELRATIGAQVERFVEIEPDLMLPAQGKQRETIERIGIPAGMILHLQGRGAKLGLDGGPERCAELRMEPLAERVVVAEGAKLQPGQVLDKVPG